MREANKKHTLNHRESTNKYQRKVREMGYQGMGIVEGTCGQYQALYPSVESLSGKPETISYCVYNRNSSKTLK